MKILAVNNQTPKPVPPLYPALKRLTYDKNFRVLFTAPKTGVLLTAPNEPHRVGENAGYWAENTFEPCSDVVTLQND